MTVNVNYTRKGVKKTVEFDTEQEAGIFMDGLEVRDDHSFESVDYPEKYQ